MPNQNDGTVIGQQNELSGNGNGRVASKLVALRARAHYEIDKDLYYRHLARGDQRTVISSSVSRASRLATWSQSVQYKLAIHVRVCLATSKVD